MCGCRTVRPWGRTGLTLLDPKGSLGQNVTLLVTNPGAVHQGQRAGPDPLNLDIKLILHAHEPEITRPDFSLLFFSEVGYLLLDI